MIFELVQDFADALALMPAGHPRRTILSLLEEAIRRDVHFIDRHPTTLFQCMWNTCWWYDCPEATGHYELLDGDAHEPYAWDAPGEKLHRLLSRWHKSKKKAEIMQPWARSLRPSPLPLNCGQLGTIADESSSINDVAISEDAAIIAYARSDFRNSSIQVYDRRRNQIIVSIPVSSQTYDLYRATPLAISPDGHFIADSYDRGSVSLTSISHAAQFAQRAPAFQIDGNGGCLAFDSTGCYVTHVSSPGVLQQWKVNSESPPIVYSLSTKWAHCVALSRHAAFAAVSFYDGTVHQFRVGERTPFRIIASTRAKITALAVTDSGDLLAAGHEDGTVMIWRGDAELTLRVSNENITVLRFSDDARVLVCAGYDRTIHVIDLRRQREHAAVAGHADSICSLAMSANAVIASASRDNTVKLWSLQAVRGAPRLRNHTGHPFLHSSLHTAISQDGKYVASGADDNVLRVWDAITGVELCFLTRIQRSDVSDLAFSPNCKYLAVCGSGSDLDLWDVTEGNSCPLAHGRLQSRDLETNGWSKCLAWSGNSDCIAVGDSEGRIRLWERDSDGTFIEAPRSPIRTNDESITSLVFSEDGAHFASGSEKGQVQLWDRATGSLLDCLRQSGDEIKRLAFLGDEILWFSGYEQFTRRNLATGRQVDQKTSEIMWASPIGPYYHWVPKSIKDGTLIESPNQTQVFFPFRVWRMTTYPPGKTWAAVPLHGKHLLLFTIET